MSEFKVCKGCAESKAVSLFAFSRGMPRSYCKPCWSRKNCESDKLNRERVNRRIMLWNHARKPVQMLYPLIPRHIQAARRKAQNIAWKLANPEKHAESQAKWAAANKHISMEVVRRRQAKKLKATPKWASREAMQAFYRMAVELTEMGVPHDVDHIIPLQHKLVCGLHCEANLQVLPRWSTPSKKGKWSSGVRSLRCDLLLVDMHYVAIARNF
jgi:hypothetical protein